MKFGCASGGSPWRSSLLSLYRVPRSGKLLSSLVPIADISSKKRKLLQTDGAEDENVKVCKPKKEGEPEDYIDDIADEEEEEEDSDMSKDSDMTGDDDDDDDDEELHDCDEEGGRRRKSKKKKSKGRSKRSRRKKTPRIVISKKGPNAVLKRKGSKPKRVKTIHALSRGKGRSRPTPVLIT